MDSEYIGLILGIAPVWFIAVLTPGPNFLITTRTSMESSRKGAAFVVLGIVAGTFIWSLAAFFGISWLFQIAPWLYRGLKIAGAAYLIYLGITSIMDSRKSELHAGASCREISSIRAFSLGFLTNITNPKTAMFISSIFATMIPRHTPMAIGLVCSLLIILISLVWYGLVVTLFSTEFFSARYLKHRRSLKAISGVAYIGLGLRIGLNRSWNDGEERCIRPRRIFAARVFVAT